MVDSTRTPDLLPASTIADIVANTDLGGGVLATRRVPLADAIVALGITAALSDISVLQADVSGLQAAQGAGAAGFDTLAHLNANLNYPANTIGNVFADSTPSNNGTYLKSGASGSGSWSYQSAGFAILSTANTWAQPQTFPAGSVSSPSVKVGAGLGLFSPATNVIAIASQSTQMLALGGAGLNTAVGPGALAGVTTGVHITAIGTGAASGVTAANYLVAIGENAGASITADYNIAIGRQAGTSIGGVQNVAIGVSALQTAQTTDNIAIGANALQSLTTGGGSISGSTGNIGIGSSSLTGATTGSDNVAIGTSALAGSFPTANTASGNIAIGKGALGSISTGSENTAVGHNCMPAATTGGSNVAVGVETLFSLTTGTANTGFGQSALHGVTTGGTNTAVGNGAGSPTTGTGHGPVTGSNNTFLGSSAQYATATEQNFMTVIGANATGDQSNSVFLGRATDSVRFGGAAGPATVGSAVFAAGTTAMPQIVLTSGVAPTGGALVDGALWNDGSLKYRKGSVTIDILALSSVGGSSGQLQYNSGSGTFAGLAGSSISGSALTLGAALTLSAGALLLPAGSVASPEIRLGGDASSGIYRPAADQLALSIAGARSLWLGDTSFNTALGYSALSTGTLTTGVQNVAVGYNAGAYVSSGSYCTLLGYNAGALLGAGSYAVAIGRNAMSIGAGGQFNIAIGVNALTHVSGNDNMAIGTNAMLANTSGVSNVAIGSATLAANTTGNQNVAIGINSLAANTTASGNVGVGDNTLAVNTTGFENTAIGHIVLNSNTTGTNVTGVGAECLFRNTTGDGNCAFGVAALHNVTTGDQNTGVGFGAGGFQDSDPNAVTTGSNNTFLGAYSDQASATQQNQLTVIGANASAAVSNAVVLGRLGTDVVYAGETVLGPNSAVVGAGATARTVATLPAASAALKGARSFVIDAAAPTFLGALTGGGSVVCPVFCNGAAWVSG